MKMLPKSAAPANGRVFLWLLGFLLLLITPLALAAPSTPTEDFTENGDGTVTHYKTGLIWKRCVEGRYGSVPLALARLQTTTGARTLAHAYSKRVADHR